MGQLRALQAQAGAAVGGDDVGVQQAAGAAAKRQSVVDRESLELV
ncbi:hypothetical protein GALL_470650 [mine drainage metagenome]|uniref:Uncharacterized protein n=1 Tax=mine drainage metagenome TaxID=410659 RepID=A0A1J5PUA4_9ZZZZ